MARNQILLHILKLRQHIKYISLYIKRWRDAIKLVKNESEKNAILYCIYVYACCVYDCHPAECSFGAHDCLWKCECTHTLRARSTINRHVEQRSRRAVLSAPIVVLVYCFTERRAHCARGFLSLTLTHTIWFHCAAHNFASNNLLLLCN